MVLENTEGSQLIFFALILQVKRLPDE